jgi:D-xylose transport system ATP-binding protein
MTTPLVEMRDIRVSFGGIHAVDGVTVDLFPGEVVGLLGHNGAGKSTLIKVLSGAYKADAGAIYINGEQAEIANPRDARRYNIETIYQTLALADNLTPRRTSSSAASSSPAPASSTTTRWRPRPARS